MIVRVALGIAGGLLIISVIDAAIRTFVLPRGVSVRFTAAVANSARWMFHLVANRFASYDARDRVMALYAPVTLLLFPASFISALFVGFGALFVAIDDVSFGQALRESGSALFTLGYATPQGAGAVGVVFVAAALGLTILALLISYLPSIYGAFSRREVEVTRLSVRAGTPPTGVELLERAQRADFFDRLPEMWETWEQWFVELEETHTSFVALNFFRSPNPHRSWITAVGAVLDGASLRLSAIDGPRDTSAAISIRVGFLALRSIASFFGLPFDPDPPPDGPISVARDEFDAAWQRLADSGLPMVDQDEAWTAFRGWRVNYDAALVGIAGLLMAPYAPWSSDRSVAQARSKRRPGWMRADSIRDERMPEA